MGCRLLLAGLLAALAASPNPALAQDRAGRPEVVIDSQGFNTTINTLDFSPDGRWLAAGGADKVVRIWDVRTGELLWTLRGERGDGPLGEISAVRFSPSGRELVVSVITFHRGQSVRIYNTDNFDEIAGGLPEAGAAVMQLAFCRDFNILATGDQDSRITFWDWRTRRPMRSVQVDIVPRELTFLLPGVLCYQDQSGAKGHVPSLEYGRKGLSLAVERYATMFKIQNVAESKQTVSQATLEVLEQFATLLSQVIVTGSAGEALPYSGLQAAHWDIRLDRSLLFASGQGKDANGASIFWAGAKPVEGDRWNAYYNKHKYTITALRSSADGRLVATGDLFGEVHIWNAQTGQTRHRFQGLSRPMYTVAFDSTGTQVGYGTTPYRAPQWGLNSYGAIHRSFDFPTRRLTDVSDFVADRVEAQLGNRTLELELDKEIAQLSYVVSKRNGVEDARISVSLDLPACYGFLRAKNHPFGQLFFMGSQSGDLRCHDTTTSLYRRFFHGPTAFVTCAADSPDGRFLVSTSTDGVIRLHSLENFKPLAMPDALASSGFIVQFVPNSAAEKAGLQIGDRVVKVDNYSLAEVLDLCLSGKWPYRAGQEVQLTVERRDGTPFSARVPLVDSCDYAEPLLNLFISRDDEWIAWTPQGYFDSSLGGDRLIGWHVSQGPLQAAKYFPVHQFRKEFYRPDIIDQVLKTGTIPLVASATIAPTLNNPPDETVPSQNQGKTAVVIDLRKEDALEQREPPKVRITQPRNNAKVRSDKIKVEIEVTRSNELDVKEATFLVGSRPQVTVDLRKENQDALVYEQEVTLLPGSNKISVLAANDVSQSLPANITVTYEPATPMERTILPDLYVLSVGISKYKNSDLDLKFAHNDAEEFTRSWQKQEGHPYRKVETRVITNEKATLTNILSEMEWLVRNCTQSDVAVLFFSAHGMRDTRNSFYLATHDINPDNLRGTGVRWTEVTELLKDLKGKVLVFVDTCHAGGITGDNRKAVNVDDPLRDLVSDDVGAVVFSSSLPREVSLELQEHGHGAFTKAVLDAFGDKASDQDQDGYLSVTEMQFQVEQRVKQLTKGAQHPSTQRSTSMPSFNFYGYPKR